MATTTKDDEATKGYHKLATPHDNATEAQVPWRQQPNPMGTGSQVTRSLLFWLDPLLRRGAKQPLMEDDVWELSPDDKTAALRARFLRHWELEKTDHAKPKLYRAVLRTLAWEAIVGMLMYALNVALVLFQPTVIKALLQYLDHADETKVDTALGVLSGYALAGVLAGLSFASVTVLDASFYVAAKAATNVKSIVMDMVFAKALRLSGFAQRATTTGDVVTMLAVDSSRLFLGYAILPWAVMPMLMLPLVFVLIGCNMDALSAASGAAALALVLGMGYRYSVRAGLLQRDLMATQSERLKLTNELLQGIRVVKMYGWEAFAQAELAAIRTRELRAQRQYLFASELSAMAMLMAPAFSLLVCILVFVGQGNPLTPVVAFTVLAYTNVARLPCNMFAAAVMRVTESLASSERVTAFLLADEVECLDGVAREEQGDVVVEVVDGSFSWAHSRLSLTPQANDDATTTSPPSTLHDISLSVTPKSLTIVVGPVGSGKSSLLSAILGEIHLVGGRRDVRGRVAYVSQEAWIQHGSVRDNVCFAATADADAFDEFHYDRVLRACQLMPDLAILPDGDATEIGERGINLSGGQKARVSLARAMYRSPHADLYLLDDPLSALDMHVAGAVFRDGVRGLLQDKTVVLVLNSHYHLLPHADHVVVMDQGRIVGAGTFASLQGTFPHLKPATECNTSNDVDDDVATARPHESTEDATDAITPTTTADKSKSKPDGQLVQKEERALGVVSAATYVAFFNCSGWSGAFVLVMIVVAYSGAQTLMVLADWYMGRWAHGTASSSTATSALTYSSLALASFFLVFGRGLFVLVVNLACAKALHETLVHKLMHAPVPSFFDVTPLGRILNRFSSDLHEIESRMPTSELILLQFSFQVAGVLVVCAAVSPYMLLVYVPLALAYYKIQVYFGRSSSELMRLAALARTPVVNLVSETLHGLSTIRAFGMTTAFETKSRAAIDRAQSYFLIQFMASRWLQMRLDWLSAAIVAGVSFLCVASRDTIGVTAAGLALTYASQLSGFLSRVVMTQTEVDDQMTCVERLLHYNSLETEGSTLLLSSVESVPHKWPQHGAVAFESYSMRYRDNLDLVLHDVSFAVRGSERIGICGRTGSGKSSLMVALFRTVEATSGCIRIDGVNIAAVNLHTLRSRLTIIPQDPVLFSGSLRFNLDPSREAATDDELWTVLKQVHLAHVVSDQGGLNFEVAEKGSNLSVGQRQLLCIARALLRHSRVVVLDEATANIDLESDRLIQETIKTCFDGVTMLVIAHRLDTILDSDRILVMDQGLVKEFDTPKALLANPDSAFAALSKQAHNLQF
ncbi:Aste57867_15601 [Aphanomyces stellatus]|uniref:Aste57867_15601 protein n=1 Tax=Aphanomyces stellatus TaxID=120398 RepID=A0A485L4I1_9STRA|nr:hypothetical protein As57867_015545 [Aphanomyces stellatus]VFT92403.1 Aste57867_15601 [Aphanomyces stellatus]